MTDEKPDEDLSALAKGGRQEFLWLHLAAGCAAALPLHCRPPLRPDALGRFASALVVVELVALVCAMGEKRGLAQRLSEGEDTHPANLVYDGMLLALLFSALAAAFFWFVPAPLFPSGEYTELDRFIVLAIPGYALTEIVLAAQAYKYDIATTVRARAVG